MKPNARQSALVQEPEGRWLAWLQSPPVDGKANAELIALVAKQFRCPKSAVTIKSGQSGRIKLLVVQANTD